MTALLERLEGAREGSRELDALVTVALRLDCKRNMPDDLQYLSAIRRDDECAPGTYWYVCRSGRSLRTSEPVTTSIDAALALAERVGMRPYMADATIKGRWRWMLDNPAFLGDLEAEPWSNGTAATPALAICAALIRATAKEEAGG